jgi:hypothetical protein
MVTMATTSPLQAYDVYDVEGRHLGRVVAPEGPPRLGPGAGTVLLLRVAQEHAAHR